MSFKNLRNPASNENAPTKEEVAPFPYIDDARVNGDRVNTTPDREGALKWGAPETLPEARPPMKLK